MYVILIKTNCVFLINIVRSSGIGPELGVRSIAAARQHGVSQLGNVGDDANPKCTQRLGGNVCWSRPSMIGAFPFLWGDVNDAIIDTDHDLAVLNIDLHLHRARGEFGKIAGV